MSGKRGANKGGRGGNETSSKFSGARESAVDAEIQKRLTNPSQRLSLFESARRKLDSMMGEHRAVIEAMEFSQGASQREREAAGLPKAKAYEIKREKLLQAIGQLEGLLSVFPAEVRGKVGGFATLAKIGTGDKALADFMVQRIQMIDVELERALKKEYDARLHKIFERSKPTKNKPGEKPRGKIGATVHDLFVELRKALEYNSDEVAAHIAGLESLIATGELTAEQEAHARLEIGLVPLVGDWKNADSERRAKAVESVSDVFTRAYEAFKNQKLDERDRRKGERLELRADTGKEGVEKGRKASEDYAKKWLGATHKFSLSFYGFEQMAYLVFGENSAGAKKLVEAERAASNKKEDTLQEKFEDIDRLFERLAGDSLKAQEMRHQMAEVRQDTNIFRRAVTPIGIKGSNGVYYSEFEAIAASLMWRQEDGKRHMLGAQDETGRFNGPWHYDQGFVTSLESQLSPAAKEVRDFLAEQYEKEYAPLNAVYSRLFGVNLPRHRHYSPLTVKPKQAKEGEAIDPVTGSVVSPGGFTPGGLLSRGSSIAQPDFRDALQTYMAHTMQMEHWKAYAPFAMEASAILGNRELQNSVTEKSGEQANIVLSSWIKYFAQGGSVDAAAHLAANQAIGDAMSRAASAALVGRMSVLAIQATQLGAAANAMPVGSYVKRMSQLMSGQLEWGSALNSPYIQRRLQQMPPIVRQAMHGLRSGKPNALKHAMTRVGNLISGADALFTAGTYAMIYDYNLKVVAPRQGISGPDAEAFAHAEAERETDKVAQPTRAGARSLFENTNTNPAMRLLWAFSSEPRQKLMLAIYAMARRPLNEKARAVWVAWGMGGILAEIIRSIVRDARDPEDEEWFDDKHWNIKRMGLAALNGPLKGVPFVGSAAEGFIYNAAGQYLPEGNLLSGAEKAAGAFKHADDIVRGERDFSQVMRDAEGLLEGMALFSGNAAAAASLTHLARDLYGVGANIAPDEE